MSVTSLGDVTGRMSRRHASRLEPAVLPLNCSYETFLASWRATRCVLLRQSRSSHSTRSASAIPRICDALLSTLSQHSDALEDTFAAEWDNIAERSGKRAKRAPHRELLPKPPSTAAALLGGGEQLPIGRFYASFVISQQPTLVRSLLEHLHGLSPPCFGASVQEEDALWFFVGCNACSGESQYLHGRPSHTDAVKHDGTFHRQLAGRKEWEVRPTEELLSSLHRQGESSATCRITCEEGDVLVISTRDWWHCTRLPPSAFSNHLAPCTGGTAAASVDVAANADTANGEAGEGAQSGGVSKSMAQSPFIPTRGVSYGVSVSIAREFNLGGPQRHHSRSAESGQGDRDATSFINVDGLFATARIGTGTVIFTEEEAEGLELPVEADPNCEVCEDEATGAQVLVARRDIRSGEFFSIGADDSDG